MNRRTLQSSDWYLLGWQTWLLAVESSCVIASRLGRLGVGDDAARTEFDRMISEKPKACLDLQAKLVSMGPAATPAASMHTAIKHFRGKVTASRSRLGRRG